MEEVKGTMLNDALKNVSVLGAAGKMGSGISLLLLQEMARLEAEQTGNVGGGNFRLHLIDANEETLGVLRRYLRAQMQRYAEKNINVLRKYFANNAALISNEEMIHTFVEGAMDMALLGTDLEAAKNSYLIFEAILEDLDLKTKVFSSLNKLGREDAYYFTNTSSIPIGLLSERCGLQGRLIGYHFYNPPAVQRLLEIIPPKDADLQLIEYAQEIARRLGKVVIFSHDVAGFIGNGHFIREIDVASRQVNELEKEHSRIVAIAMVNRVTHEFLLRPMGVFQLIDYVGIDICQRVMSIMSQYLEIPFDRELIDDMLQAGKRGGVHPDGSQKEGFFQYEGHNPIKIYSCSKRQYVALPEGRLGDLPAGHIPWKELHKKKNKDAVLEKYFQNLFRMDSFGAQLASTHLMKSREIARNLVKDGVAKNIEDVSTVLMNGFYHLYGADNAWIPQGIPSGAS